MAAKENADIPLTGRRRTLLPIQHHGESARCLSCPDRTILLTRAPGRPLVYGLPSHLPAMTGFRPSGFPPRPYSCAYSADRVGHCTPFLPGENLTELKARAIAMRRHRTHIFCCHQKAVLSQSYPICGNFDKSARNCSASVPPDGGGDGEKSSFSDDSRKQMFWITRSLCSMEECT